MNREVYMSETRMHSVMDSYTELKKQNADSQLISENEEKLLTRKVELQKVLSKESLNKESLVHDYSKTILEGATLKDFSRNMRSFSHIEDEINKRISGESSSENPTIKFKFDFERSIEDVNSNLNNNIGNEKGKIVVYISEDIAKKHGGSIKDVDIEINNEFLISENPELNQLNLNKSEKLPVNKRMVNGTVSTLTVEQWDNASVSDKNYVNKNFEKSDSSKKKDKNQSNSFSIS